MDTQTLPHPQYIAGTWKLDKDHSELNFSVRHLAISKVRGAFDDFDATIVTAADPKDSTIEATIDVASVNTNQAQRDDHLRTSDFFKVDEFPTARFTASDFAIDGEDFTVTGDLTLRGITKPITLKGEFGGVITDGYDLTRAGASATATFNRHDFGVSWNAALEAGGLTLGDDITLSADLEVVLQP